MQWACVVVGREGDVRDGLPTRTGPFQTGDRHVWLSIGSSLILVLRHPLSLSTHKPPTLHSPPRTSHAPLRLNPISWTRSRHQACTLLTKVISCPLCPSGLDPLCPLAETLGRMRVTDVVTYVASGALSRPTLVPGDVCCTVPDWSVQRTLLELHSRFLDPPPPLLLSIKPYLRHFKR